MGLSGTFVGRNLIANAGLICTGIMATTFQAVVLCSAAVIYHLHLAAGALVPVSCPFRLEIPGVVLNKALPNSVSGYSSHRRALHRVQTNQIHGEVLC